MGVGEGKKQIPVILPIEVIELLDNDAREQLRSRSSQAAKIIMEYYDKKGKGNNDGK